MGDVLRDGVVRLAREAALEDRGGMALESVALALVYVGDQIGRLVSEERDERGALIDSGYVPLETRLLDAGEGRAHFAIGPRVFEVMTGQQFELFIDAAGRVNARESAKPYKDALEKIAKHKEHFGSGPPDDEMREIAIGALAAGER